MEGKIRDLFDESERHPSYGLLAFSRVTQTSKCTLFGSSIPHSDITSANKGRKDVGAGKRQKHGRTCVEAYA